MSTPDVDTGHAIGRPGGASRCPACDGAALRPFFEMRGVPVHSCLLTEDQEAALHEPRCDLELALCLSCGFITNVAFDPLRMRYSDAYEDQQSYSATFNQFARDLAARLVDRYALRDKDVVEIGCGKGDFLLLLCELGDNRGVGIDPSVRPDRLSGRATERLRLLRELYSARHADLPADFICCRHTLEHVHDVRGLVTQVRRAIGERRDVAVFFEVPDVMRVLSTLGFEDVYNEHCSYFSPGSLARLFRRSGFEMIDLYRGYDDQYLFIEARPDTTSSAAVHPLEESLEDMERAVAAFSSRVTGEIERCRRFFRSRGGSRPAIWGSGSKCVALLSALGRLERMPVVVDVNPHRHGKFLPGHGLEIRPPQALREYHPDVVVVMNAQYEDEVRSDLRSMGLAPKIVHRGAWRDEESP